MQKLLDILKHPNDMLIAFDLDGVLCHGEFWGDKSPEPNKEMIELVWKLYKKGAHIVICTARNIEWTKETYSWLDKHGVPYHGLMMNRKPGADLYIDDKSINPNDINIKKLIE